MQKMKIDDPLDAFAVHGGCGAWGVLAVGLFDTTNGGFYGDNGRQFGVQLLGVVVISAWTAFFSALMFVSLKYMKLLRISEEEEKLGIDNVEHGGAAYHINENKDDNENKDNDNHNDENKNDENKDSDNTNIQVTEIKASEVEMVDVPAVQV